MAKEKRAYIANQVFVGLPWKNVRPKYDKIIPTLEKKYPLHFVIVGRNDKQDAQGLFDLIKQRIESCSYAVFDATTGNANVSLEYGYAEGKGIPRAIFLSDHKATKKQDGESPIISDLIGLTRVQYKNQNNLLAELQKLCREHSYTKRYEKGVRSLLKGKSAGSKKRYRALALKTMRLFDGRPSVRRAEIVQSLQAQNYKAVEIEATLKKLHGENLIKVSVGKYSDVTVA